MRVPTMLFQKLSKSERPWLVNSRAVTDVRQEKLQVQTLVTLADTYVSCRLQAGTPITRAREVQVNGECKDFMGLISFTLCTSKRSE